MGTLFLVATPIGNLEDITLRAIAILKQVGLIAAEDTRQTHKLLDRFQINTPLVSYHEHNKLTRVEQILEALSKFDVALVSDAGTPALNDPGYELVRAALKAGFLVSPIPGPSAPIAALVASGLPTDAFIYLGYLPRKSTERLDRMVDVAKQPYTLIFLETPHRLVDALEDIQHILGERQVAVARELTKMHEEIFRGSITEAIEHFKASEVRGEITLVIAGYQEESREWTEERLRKVITNSFDTSIPLSQLSSDLSVLSGWPRRTIYRIAAEIRAQERP
jgi:16S rRNA (cytidine1402-2'-O)-methyltransferase